MARKTITGLYEKGGVWQIDKVYKGERIRESTGTGDREEAEQYLIHKLEQLRHRKVYGVRQVHTWEEAAMRYLLEVKRQVALHRQVVTRPRHLDLPAADAVPVTGLTPAYAVVLAASSA